MMGKPFWLWLVAWRFGLGFIPLISTRAVIEVGPGKKYSKTERVSLVPKRPYRDPAECGEESPKLQRLDLGAYEYEGAR